MTNRLKTIRTLLFTTLLVLTGLCACTTKANKTDNSADQASEMPKSLVCYFSATGTTAEAAHRIAEITGADIYEITPATRYTDADLDWRDSLSRSFVEMHNRNSRPAIVDSLPDMKQYDVIYIGYPNWWNTHPTIINTFIEANDFKGKTVVPFMTSGGSDIINSEKELKESYPTLTFAKGLLMNGVSDEDIKAWAETSSSHNDAIIK